MYVIACELFRSNASNPVCSEINMFFLLYTLFVLCATTWVQSVKILGVIPTPVYSHYSLGKALMDGLVEKGHDVTVISPFEEKGAKFKSVYLDGLLKTTQEMFKRINMFEIGARWKIFQIIHIHKMGLLFTKQTFDHPAFQKFMASNETFDIIIFEKFANEAVRGICHHFKANCVVLSCRKSSYWTNIPSGNPENPASVPMISLGHFGPMDFLKRFENTLLNGFAQLYSHLFAFREQEEAMRTIFPNAPPLNELLYEPTLYLINSHASTAAPVPLLPNMVEIGGYHVKPPKKLPEDLQKYLDSAEEGVIYFSMGSHLKSKDFPVEKRKAFMEAFSKLKVKVLWKFEEDLPEKPANIKISKCLPQNDILAHSNIKLFISHGGSLSTIEAIYHGVPVIGIPIFGDQASNMASAMHSGFAISLDYRSLTEETLTQTLYEILNNKKYSENAKQLSKIMHDRPMKPLDTALYWIEYVARHKGVHHLKTAALDLSWYQVLLLDVLAALSLAVLFVIFVFKVCLKTCCRLICSRSVNKKKQVKKD